LSGNKGTAATEEVGEGASSRGEYGSRDEQLGTAEGGPGESGGEFDQYGQGIGEYTGHESLVAW
jgi:hypothetical protein